MYTLNQTGGVIKQVGSIVTLIPEDPTQPDWLEYQEWLAQGNNPQEYHSAADALPPDQSL